MLPQAPTITSSMPLLSVVGLLLVVAAVQHAAADASAGSFSTTAETCLRRGADAATGTAKVTATAQALLLVQERSELRRMGDTQRARSLLSLGRSVVAEHRQGGASGRLQEKEAHGSDSWGGEVADMAERLNTASTLRRQSYSASDGSRMAFMLGTGQMEPEVLASPFEKTTTSATPTGIFAPLAPSDLDMAEEGAEAPPEATTTSMQAQPTNSSESATTPSVNRTSRVLVPEALTPEPLAGTPRPIGESANASAETVESEPTMAPLANISSEESANITEMRKLAALDCKLGSWGDWSVCVGEEDDGLKSWNRIRTREVINPQQAGGRPCTESIQRVQCRYMWTTVFEGQDEAPLE
mmetsp:Transcript_60673/g.130262  ORF Transcript_60673/g.130262 Transcript_60673/m.130262 type:complete len:356 (-) Transcript_60673:25-1092(-)